MGKTKPLLISVGTALVAIILFTYLVKPALDKAFKKDGPTV